jgi:hypothetical protein
MFAFVFQCVAAARRLCRGKGSNKRKEKNGVLRTAGVLRVGREGEYGRYLSSLVIFAWVYRSTSAFSHTGSGECVGFRKCVEQVGMKISSSSVYGGFADAEVKEAQTYSVCT